MRKRWTGYAVWCVALALRVAYGQEAAPAKVPTRAGVSEPVSSEKDAQEQAPSQSDSEPAKKPGKLLGNENSEPITTEIYADKTVFDSAKSIGTFSGHVVVTDPRFKIQGDKLTIYINKNENEGLEKAIVEGNVGVVRDRPSPTNGGPPEHMVGRSDKAVYTVKDGRFELTGNPRVQQGVNTHVATSPDTIMILTDTGQLETHGPSRTEIRQQPNSEKEKAPPKP